MGVYRIIPAVNLATIDRRAYAGRLRAVAGKTTREHRAFARAAGIAPSALCNYFNGCFPASAQLFAMARVVQQPMAWFLDGQPRPRVVVCSIEIDPRVVAERVRWCCDQVGSPKALAYEIGVVSATAIYHYVKGRRIPSSPYLYFMSLKVERPMEWILGCV